MDKKKIVFIVLTVISVVISAVACALGIPFTPVDIGCTDIVEDGECSDGEAAEEQSATSEKDGYVVSVPDTKTA